MTVCSAFRFPHRHCERSEAICFLCRHCEALWPKQSVLSGFFNEIATLHCVSLAMTVFLSCVFPTVIANAVKQSALYWFFHENAALTSQIPLGKYGSLHHHNKRLHLVSWFFKDQKTKAYLLLVLNYVENNILWFYWILFSILSMDYT